MDKNLTQLDVVAVGAHPDDMEIACGGTLAKLAQQGYRVGIIDLTDGEPTPLSPGPEHRLGEAKAAAEILGVHRRLTLSLPNRKLFDSFEARVLLAKQLRRFRPRLVIGLQGSTPLASPDHWQAMQITDAAVFYSRLTKWDDQFDQLPPHPISAQLYSTLIWPPSEMLAQPGSLLIDIGDTLEKKIAAVRCYATQFPPEKAYVLKRIQSGAEFLGQAAGVAAAEVLVSPRPVATDDVMQWLFGRR